MNEVKGIALYSQTFLDIFFTLKGVRGDIAMEGNPIIRYMMVNLGLVGGLVVGKGLVLLLGATVAIISFIGIEKEADWVYYLAFTRVTRNWMKRKKRYWVAFLPIYFVAISQGIAATSWILLITE